VSDIKVVWIGNSEACLHRTLMGESGQQSCGCNWLVIVSSGGGSVLVLSNGFCPLKVSSKIFYAFHFNYTNNCG
jgi:hypothetical protein